MGTTRRTDGRGNCPAGQAGNSASARGSALVVALSFAALLALLVTALITRAMAENMGTDSLVGDAQARYLAEAGAEYAIRQLKTNIANNYALPAGGNTVVLTGYLPGFAKNTQRLPVVQWKAVRIETTPTRTSKDSDGVTHTYQLYAVTGWCVLLAQGSPARYNEVYVNKMLDLDMVPLFQYLAFYNAYDMEMLPGNNATLQGRIHSNYDIYMGAEAGNTLTVDSYSIKATGTLQRQRKDNPPSASNHYMTGTVQVSTASAAVSVPPTAMPTINAANFPVLAARGTLATPSGALVPTSVAPSGNDSNFLGYDGNNDGKISGTADLAGFAQNSASTWGGSIQTGANNVPTLAAPTDIRAFRPPVNSETPNYAFNSSTQTWQPASGSAATSVKGNYNQNANLVLQSNGTKTQLLLNGTTPTVLLELNGGTVSTNLLKNAAGAAVNPLSEKTMFDGREYDPATDASTSGTVKVTQVDMGVLNTAQYAGAPIFPTTGSGSMIYAYRTDTTAQNPYGFRLTNGATLNNNMTLVSEDPVYVKGNFNTVAGSEKGVILMADAINLLGNEWNDSMTKSSTLPVPTSNLEINAAIMSGSYATKKPDANGNGGVYNGGFENFPRFHEDWSASGKTVNMLGSFNSLFPSTYAQGKWVYGGLAYTAPVRNWKFDTGFLTQWANLPGMPVSVGETRVVWWLGRQMQWWP